MSLTQQLETELNQRVGFRSTSPDVVTLSAPDNIQVAIAFTAIDSMSCSFAEIRLDVPRLVGADFDRLREWGQALCQRVTYLLENIGPLESDPDAGQILIRSTPPGQNSGQTLFYEILLQSQSNGQFTLRRYESRPGSGRTQVDIQATHEVLTKLINDLVDTIPPKA